MIQPTTVNELIIDANDSEETSNDDKANGDNVADKLNDDKVAAGDNGGEGFSDDDGPDSSTDNNNSTENKADND